MKASSIIIIIICVTILGISTYPGILHSLLFVAILLSFLVVPGIGIVALLAFKRKPKSIRFTKGRVGIVLTVLCMIVLLNFYVPRRIAFALSRPAFERLVSDANSWKHLEEGTTLGVYKVDVYAPDPRGGIYFRVYSGIDGLGPDELSYGFAYKPNTQGTPFGAARYSVFSLGDDWYWFRASNDWF